MPRSVGLALRWLFWAAVLVLATAAMLSVRDRLDAVHAALIYLLIVLFASASGGRLTALVLAMIGYGLIDYYFLPPYEDFSFLKNPDWLVLITFVSTAMVAAHLLSRAHAEAAAARERAEEIDRLSALGAETLSAGRAEVALAAIARVVRETLGAARCEIYLGLPERGTLHLAARDGAVPDEGHRISPLVAWVAEHGRAAAELADGGVHAMGERGQDGSAGLALEARDARALILPLHVHGQTVGVLALAGHGPLLLRAEQHRFLAALAYYAALGIERVRLVAEAEHAEALREADRLKDALLASVSHDLRTPLTTIKAVAHDIAAVDHRAAVIEQQADRLNRVVADLLDLSRLNAGAFPVRAEINAAEDLVGAAIQQASGAFPGREIRALIEWSAPVLVGRFDFVHSLRVLVNLIENALKYSPAGSPVEVEVARQDAHIAISVLDRGPGVPAVERERIFEPFYRRTGVSPDAGGAGLGLAIARRLAEEQGGRLTYRDREGGGSRFTIYLPAADLAGTEGTAAAESPEPRQRTDSDAAD